MLPPTERREELNTMEGRTQLGIPVAFLFCRGRPEGSFPRRHHEDGATTNRRARTGQKSSDQPFRGVSIFCLELSNYLLHANHQFTRVGSRVEFLQRLKRIF